MTIMAILLVLMTGMVIGVLHADWGAIAPSPDSLWSRTREILCDVYVGLQTRVTRMVTFGSPTSEGQNGVVLPRHRN